MKRILVMLLPIIQPTQSQQSAQHYRFLNSRVGALLTFAVSILMVGCAVSQPQWEKTLRNETSEIDQMTQQVDNPSPPVYQEVSMTADPVTASTLASGDVIYLELSLDDTLKRAMQHSTVLRDIGGVVLRSPDNLKTGFSTKLQETDPRFGMEAALSVFDAQLAASASFNNNDRLFNNAFFAGGTSAFQQDLHDYEVELSKRTATGARLALRGVTNYDSNNAPANTFPSSWNNWLEGEIRTPLLQGAGLEFNRIAGPGGRPGVYNGVLIAKVNSDMNHAQFMRSLRDFVSNVENAYWDLYFAYRELDARKKAMERALVAWNNAKARKDAQASNPRISEEALARQQYYQFKADVDEALSGRLLQGTQTQNGSSGGTLRLQGGVLTAERRLRLLVGLQAADGQLLRPSEEPTMAELSFDWHSCMNEAIRQRPELQRRHLTVKKREMELLAAKNFLNPRLDAVGRYRFRGFGKDLTGAGGQSGVAPASAIGNLTTGDNQEWMLGVELTIPVGYRQGHAAVQNAELALARERAIQKEQQREVTSNLNGAIADASRAWQAVQNHMNQYEAAAHYMQALETRSDDQVDDGTDRLADSHRRLLQAEIQFFRARAEYAVALKNVHYEKGSLLSYRDMRIQGASSLGGGLPQPYPESETFEAPASGDNELPAVPDTPVGFNNPASAFIQPQGNTTSDVSEYWSNTDGAQAVVQTSATDRQIGQKVESDQVPVLTFNSHQLEQELADQQHAVAGSAAVPAQRTPKAHLDLELDDISSDAPTTQRGSNTRSAKRQHGAGTSSGGGLWNKWMRRLR
jgi:hypothetical protein